MIKLAGINNSGKLVIMFCRKALKLVQEAMSDTPVVCVLGPRQSGKSTLVQMVDSKREYISFDSKTVRETAMQDPEGFILSLPARVTLDEVQRVPEIFTEIKASVDEDRSPGRFLLTGSSNLRLLPAIQDSLAGRMEVIQLLPLTEAEKQNSQYNFVDKLLNNQYTAETVGDRKQIMGLAKAVCFGGYPEPCLRSEKRAWRWHREYLKAIIERDVKDIAKIYDATNMMRLTELTALRTSSTLNINNLSMDLGIARKTVETYLQILERLFLIRRLPAWHSNRGKRLIKAPKIHMLDSGLACALNRFSEKNWLDYSNRFGGVLESFAIQQIICLAQWYDPDLQFSHYRDKDKNEVDLVIERGLDTWGVEIKKSVSLQNADYKGLAKLAEQCTGNWKGGVILYSGKNTVGLPVKNCLAVPFDNLWK